MASRRNEASFFFSKDHRTDTSNNKRVAPQQVPGNGSGRGCPMNTRHGATNWVFLGISLKCASASIHGLFGNCENISRSVRPTPQYSAGKMQFLTERIRGLSKTEANLNSCRMLCSNQIYFSFFSDTAWIRSSLTSNMTSSEISPELSIP